MKEGGERREAASCWFGEKEQCRRRDPTSLGRIEEMSIAERNEEARECGP